MKDHVELCVGGHERFGAWGAPRVQKGFSTKQTERKKEQQKRNLQAERGLREPLLVTVQNTLLREGPGEHTVPSWSL